MSGTNLKRSLGDLLLGIAAGVMIYAGLTLGGLALVVWVWRMVR